MASCPAFMSAINFWQPTPEEFVNLAGKKHENLPPLRLHLIIFCSSIRSVLLTSSDLFPMVERAGCQTQPNAAVDMWTCPSCRVVKSLSLFFVELTVRHYKLDKKQATACRRVQAKTPWRYGNSLMKQFGCG